MKQRVPCPSRVLCERAGPFIRPIYDSSRIWTGWPTFTFFGKVGRRHRRRERKIRMQAARVPTFARTAKVGQPPLFWMRLPSAISVLILLRKGR